MKKKLKDRVFYLIRSLDLDSDILDIFKVMEEDNLSKIKTDGIYLFGQTKDNEKSVFSSAIRAVDNSLTDNVLISGGKCFPGYQGYESWSDFLQKKLETTVLKVPLRDPKMNTLTESNSLLEYMNKEGLNSVYVTAAPFHSLRVFMTASSVVIRKNPKIKIMNLFGGQLPWNDEVYHSQGSLKATRFDLIEHEMERIKSYTKKGDILPAREILDYLKQRDN